MTKYAKFTEPTAFFIWACVALLATVVFMILASNFQSPESGRGSIMTKLLSAVSLWNDPKLWFLQCTNIAFAFAAAWLPGYVGRTILTPALGKDFIGFASALLSGLAAILSKVFGFYSQKCGKAPFLILGAIAFLCLGIFSKWIGPENPVDWKWGALIFYVFMGIGRAVYESTNKAIFSDFFPGEKSAGAFANVFVFNSGSSTIAFILGASNTILPELYLLLTFAALTAPGYLAASLLQKRTIVAQTEENAARPAEQEEGKVTK
jgi:MFS family permease